MRRPQTLHLALFISTLTAPQLFPQLQAPCVALADSDAEAPSPVEDFADLSTEELLLRMLRDNMVYALLGRIGDGDVISAGDASIVLRWTSSLHTAWYDATAPYHPTAVGVYSDLGRRPEDEWESEENMLLAMLYTSHKVYTWLQPDYYEVWDEMLTGIGLDASDTHEGTDDPIGIGNAAAAALIAARNNDGFNQLGTENGCTYNCKPYSDYTGFAPVNSAWELTDARMWQPQEITDSFGLRKVQAFVTPQYALTQAFSYDDVSQFSVAEPSASYDVAANGTGAAGALYQAQADDVLATSAALTEEQKLLAEFFDHKFDSLGLGAMAANTNQNGTLMDLIHLEMVLNIAAHDAGVAIWQEKTKWNAVRPFTAIQTKLYPDRAVSAYAASEAQAVDDILGSEWEPYLQSADHPEYPSASAGFCEATAVAARNYFGTDDLGYEVSWAAGGSVQEPGITPAADLTYTFATWTQFTEECGQSRVWAGVHFPDAVPAGQGLGAEIGELAYQFYLDHLNNEGLAGSRRATSAAAPEAEAPV